MTSTGKSSGYRRASGKRSDYPRLRVRASFPDFAGTDRRKPEWFKARGYKHFDTPVGARFVERVADPKFVAEHSWLPLIHYTRRVKRYKPKDGQTVWKDRPIMYASHRDACILSKYASKLTSALDEYYEQNSLCEHVIAYRKLGKSNYDFSSDAYRFSMANATCVVLCFDITGFFDNLDHSILKNRLKKVLQVEKLSDDWYKVFRHVTFYKKIERDDLAAHPSVVQGSGVWVH